MTTIKSGQKVRTDRESPKVITLLKQTAMPCHSMKVTIKTVTDHMKQYITPSDDHCTHNCNDVERHEADGERDVVPTRCGDLRGRVEASPILDSAERGVQHCPLRCFRLLSRDLYLLHFFSPHIALAITQFAVFTEALRMSVRGSLSDTTQLLHSWRPS